MEGKRLSIQKNNHFWQGRGPLGLLGLNGGRPFERLI